MHDGGDTIAAIATARGRAALAVVRLSGSDAVAIASRCFRGTSLADAAAQTAHFGRFEAADGGEIDQIVATVFRAPKSFTGEDLVELSCHGGDFASRLILEGVLRAGSRMARPGEFTERAFLNGKMDLTQAEAVADLIHASSSLAHRTAVNQLEGRYSDQLSTLRQELLDVCALVELELDFSEEDVEFADRKQLSAVLRRAGDAASLMLGTYRLGELIRDGVRVVIAGRPNAGKSTLLNALLGRDRAIVSEVPGTTRDEIEAEMEIDGLLFRFVDTAGLREAADAIEAEGVNRAHRSINRSDVVLYVFDITRGLEDEEAGFIRSLRASNRQIGLVLVGNKTDLGPMAGGVAPEVDGLVYVGLSAKYGLEDADETAPLVRALSEAVDAGLRDTSVSAVVVNERHRRHLQRILEAVQRADAALKAGATGDALAADLRIALHELGGITGEITSDDVLDQIFSRFCIGK